MPPLPPAEQRIHSGSGFTIGLFRCPISHPVFSRDAAAGAYLVVFPRSSVIIKQQGNKKLVADANTAVLYNQGQAYRREAIAPEGDRCDFFGLSDALAQQLMHGDESGDTFSGQPGTHKIFYDSHCRIPRSVYSRQRQLVHLAQTGLYHSSFWLNEQMLLTLGDLFARSSAVAQEQHYELVLRAKKFINQRFCISLSLENIAEHIGCSTFHLCRVFTRVCGHSVYQYVKELRLRHALELLLESKDELSELAQRLGFSHHSHFSSAFQKAFSLTPSQYRKLGGVNLQQTLSKNLIAH